jgi:hypothetical protein
MEKETKKLNIGDVLYSKCTYGGFQKHIIERVTATQAVTYTGVKFKREYTHWITRIGSHTYSRVSYYIETEKLKAEFERFDLLSKVQKFKFQALSTEQLLAIDKILTTETLKSQEK